MTSYVLRLLYLHKPTSPFLHLVFGVLMEKVNTFDTGNPSEALEYRSVHVQNVSGNYKLIIFLKIYVTHDNYCDNHITILGN